MTINCNGMNRNTAVLVSCVCPRIKCGNRILCCSTSNWDLHRHIAFGKTNFHFRLPIAVPTVTTRLGTSPTCSSIQTAKCFGSHQLSTKAHARSTSATFPSTSKCASWNSARGHSMATRCPLHCTITKISLICRITGNLARGTSSRCRPIWMSIRIRDNRPKRTSPSTSLFDERHFSTRSIWFCQPFWFHFSVCSSSICLPRLEKRYVPRFSH